MLRRLRHRTVRTLAAAAAAGLVLVGCSATTGSGAAQPKYVLGTGEISTVAAKGRGAPLALSGNDMDGSRLDLAAYRGKVVVVNVWGAWCSSCRGEADGLESVFEATRAKGVQFVGIDTRDLQTSQPKAFLADHRIGYPSFYDPDGELLLKFPTGTLNPGAIPSTLVLDRQGRIAARALKALSSTQLTQMLAPVLAEQG